MEEIERTYKIPQGASQELLVKTLQKQGYYVQPVTDEYDYWVYSIRKDKI